MIFQKTIDDLSSEIYEKNLQLSIYKKLAKEYDFFWWDSEQYFVNVINKAGFTVDKIKCKITKEQDKFYTLSGSRLEVDITVDYKTDDNIVDEIVDKNINEFKRRFEHHSWNKPNPKSTLEIRVDSYSMVAHSKIKLIFDLKLDKQQ